MRILSLLILSIGLLSFKQQPESPHGQNFRISCKTCHSTKGWQLDKEVYSFDHNTTALPLVGQHKVVACRQCHPTLKFAEAKTNCNECHTDIHQSTVGLDCSRCHTPSSWLVSNITEIHQRSRFPLVGSHRTADCSQCHKSESLARYDVPGVNCVDCHRQNYLATTSPNHMQSGIPEDCIQCHKINAIQWTGAGFDHSAFPLLLGHSNLKCIDCHTTGRYTAIASDCYSCHQQNYTATTNPNHIAAGIPTACVNCHSTTSGWKPASFSHTAFPLTLGHAIPTCADCHKGNYTTTPTDCYQCHQTNYNATTDPNHVTSGIPTTCTTCHTTNSGWKPVSFSHTTFPLTLGHSVPGCNDCHKGNYTTTPVDCYLCHQQNYTATTTPSHISSGIPTTCAICHTTNPGWKPAAFNHSTFPLTLGHSTPTCNDCHKGNYLSTSTDCYSCHQLNYTATTNPGHIAGGIPTTCSVCHTTNPGWAPASYNHANFPLTLGHSTPTCNDCHKGNYTSLSPDCYTCHQANYIATTDPNHVAAGIPTTCAVCHTTNPGWTPATVNHSTFPLTLGHSIPTCNDCHKGNYTSLSPDCYTCHQANYTATTNPNHIAAGIPTTCSTCHTANPGWTPATFSHTTFPLTLGHSVPTCNDCHKGNYTTTSPDCYTCHQANYTATTNPNHISAGIPTTCSTCHTANPGWTPATFNHTTFPLTLSHSTPTCNDCHKGNYTTTSTDCYTCHQSNYTATTNPNHIAAGIPTTCATCHTTNPGWTPATFTHTTFPLTLGHATPTCNDCHKGNYTTTSTVCYSCHATDYNNTTNPDHKTLSFSTTCNTCHTTTPGWKPATFTQHDALFPIYSGRHLGQWNACTDCHTNTANYASFSCIICHEHSDKASVDSHHNGVSGYTYTGTSCYTCHPTGRAG